MNTQVPQELPDSSLAQMSYLPACKPEPKRGELGFPGECLQHGGSPHAGCCEYPKLPARSEPGEAYLRTTPIDTDAVWDLGMFLNEIRRNWLAADQPDAKSALRKTFEFFADEYYEATGSRPCITCGGEGCNCVVDDIDEVQERLR